MMRADCTEERDAHDMLRWVVGGLVIGCIHICDVWCVIRSDRGEERDDKRRSRGGPGLRSGRRVGVQPWRETARHASRDD